jgi:PKD repeat protein
MSNLKQKMASGKLRFISLTTVLLITILLLGGGAQAAERWPQFGLVYQKPTDYPQAAQRYGFYWGWQDHASKLAALNPNGIYVANFNVDTARAMYTNLMCGLDYYYITGSHPEWQLYTNDGTVVHLESDSSRLDIGNPALGDYTVSWINQQAFVNPLIPASRGGGLWPVKDLGFDNGMFYYAPPNTKYSNSTWRDAYVYHYKRISDAFRPAHRVIVNMGWHGTDLTTFARMMQYLDGAMFEDILPSSSAVKNVQQYWQLSQWCAQNGKVCVGCYYSSSSANHDDFMLGYAAVLMTAGVGTYYDLHTADYKPYYFPEMDWDLGQPLGAKVEVSTLVFRRDFQNYSAFLNLSSAVYTLPDGTSLPPMRGALVPVSTPAPPPVENPVADFTVDTNSGPAPLAVKFSDTSSGTINTWLWNFGDGVTSNLQSPSHTYNQAGTYNATLTVSNATGSDSKTVLITVAAPPPPLPVASFTANPSSGPAPLTVQFTDTSSEATSWSWDFGDGSNSTTEFPTHKYGQAGNYTAKLTVRNTSGSNSKSLSIAVSESTSPSPVPDPPVADFTASTTGGQIPLTVQFTDTSTGEVTSWLWDFGDGTASTVQNPSHTFEKPGNCRVTLTVSNASGSSSQKLFISVRRNWH